MYDFRDPTQIMKICSFFQRMIQCSLLLFFTQSVYAVQSQERIVATTNTADLFGPQLGDNIFFSAFSAPILNRNGQVAFKANLTGAEVGAEDDQGIWLSSLDGIQPIARTDTTGLLGPNFSDVPNRSFLRYNLYSISLNNHGSLIFGAATTNSANYNGLFLNTGGTNDTSALVHTDGPLGPNLGGGVEFLPLMQRGTLLDSGEFIFKGFVNQNDPDAGGQSGIWKTNGGTPSLWARVGTSGVYGPGLGSDVEFTFFETTLARPERNDLIVEARLASAGITGSERGVFRLSDTERPMLAQTGVENQFGPQLGPGVQFADFDRIHNPYDEGAPILAVASLQGTGVSPSHDAGVWELSESQLTPIARSGDDGAWGPNLGAGIYFQAGAPSPVYPKANQIFRDIASNGIQHAIIASLGGGSFNPDESFGLFVGEAGTNLTAIALTGVDNDLGPSQGSNQVFQAIQSVNLNNDGSLFFSARVGEAGGTPGEFGIWAYQSGEVSPVIQVGDEFGINLTGPEDIRVVSSIISSSFNAENAQFVSDVWFDDGSRALIVFDLLTPGDANGDGEVSFLDLDILTQHFGGSGTWSQGDFNGDGWINIADLDQLLRNWTATTAPNNTIPEPGSLFAWGGGMILLTRRRRSVI